MTDTHTHIYMPEFEDGGDGAVKAALEAGVGRMVLPGVDLEAAHLMTALYDRYPDCLGIAVGLHPTELEENWREELAEIERTIGDRPVVAIGETGMDLYWDKSYEARQREAFALHIDMAAERGLPVIIHCREALEPVLEVIGEKLNSYNSSEHSENSDNSEKVMMPPLVFHSFTGSMDDVRRIREVCDPWFGINGVVTFKNAKELREALPEIGLDRMLLETDSPYLSPAPHRGKRNESSRLPLIRDMIAATLGVTPYEVETRTDQNATQLFNLN